MLCIIQFGDDTREKLHLFASKYCNGVTLEYRKNSQQGSWTLPYFDYIIVIHRISSLLLYSSVETQLLHIRSSTVTNYIFGAFGLQLSFVNFDLRTNCAVNKFEKEAHCIKIQTFRVVFLIKYFIFHTALNLLCNVFPFRIVHECVYAYIYIYIYI